MRLCDYDFKFITCLHMGRSASKNLLGFLICNKKMNEMIRDLLFPHVVDVYTDSCFTHPGMSRTCAMSDVRDM